MFSKGIRVTCQTPQPEEHNEPESQSKAISAPTNNIHDVYVQCLQNPLYVDHNTISVDLPQQYPDT